MEKKFTVRSFVESLSRPRARSLFPTYQAPRKPAWHYNPPFPPSFLPALLTCTSLVPPPPPLLLLLCPSTQEPSLLALAKVVAAAASLRKCLELVVLAFPVGLPGIDCATLRAPADSDGCYVFQSQLVSFRYGLRWKVVFHVRSRTHARTHTRVQSCARFLSFFFLSFFF